MNGNDIIPLKVSNGAMATDKLPSRIKVLAWGRNDSTKGTFILDEVSAAALSANQRARGHDRVALDFEHNTVPGSPEYERSQEPRKVAAYGTPELIPGDGLYLSALTWTPAGQTEAKNYEDLSAAISADAQNRVEFLHSVALTRNGSVFDLTFFSASGSCQKSENANKEKRMNDKFISLALLAGVLGLPAEASEQDVAGKLKGVVDGYTALGALVKDGKLIPLSAGNPADLTDLTNRIAALEARGDQAERDALIAEATRAGKVIPLSAEAIKIAPVSTLREMVGNLPANVVPLSARAGTVRDQPAGGPDRQAELRAAVDEYKTSHGCSFDQAFNAVRAAKPALFS